MKEMKQTPLGEERVDLSDERRKLLWVIEQIRNNRRFQQKIALARRNGFVDLLVLTWILAYDEQYKVELPRLWEEYHCDSYGSRQLELEKLEGRFAAWHKLLDRFSTNKLPRAMGKSSLPKIKLLQLQEETYVNLSEMAEYFEQFLKIPLPRWLFLAEERCQTSNTDKNRKALSTSKPLYGWKAIGKFLGKSSRRVQDYYRESNLPVLKQLRGGVYAYPEELNRWRDSHSKKRRARRL